MSLIQTPVSYGELIDKMTILQIKLQEIKDDAKLANVRNELGALEQTWMAHPAAGPVPGSESAAGIARLRAGDWFHGCHRCGKLEQNAAWSARFRERYGDAAWRESKSDWPPAGPKWREHQSETALGISAVTIQSRDPLAVQVEHALHTLRIRTLERRQRELRAAIAAADRAGDHELLTKLTQEKLQVDRALREL